MTRLYTLLMAHLHEIVILRVGLFVEFIPLIDKVKERLCCKTTRMIFVRARGAS